jgi:cytochrome c oxidase subunit II
MHSVLASAVGLDALLGASSVPVFAPASPNAAAVYGVFAIVLYICLGIFIVVLLMVGIPMIVWRSWDESLPKQNFGGRRIQHIWTIPPVLIVLLLAIFSSKLVLSTTAAKATAYPGPQEADLVLVGHQWWWEVRYPQSGAVTANEIHVPVGKRFRVRLESADVIHSFWCPQLAPKMDLVPGHPNFMWLQADRAGRYDGACAEFCGDQHAWMRIAVIAEDPATYQAWLARQATPAPAPIGARALAGRDYFFSQTCVNCHAIGGTGAVADAAPDLTHLADRGLLAGGIIPNTPEELARWLRNPQAIKPGCLMPTFPLNDEQANDLVTYLEGSR